MKRQAIWRWALPIIVLLMSGGLYWWYVMLSPHGHTLPPDPDGIYLQAEHGLFAYGTLTSPVVRWVVLGESIPAEPAHLEGYRRQGMDLVAAPGQQVMGKYLLLSGPQLRRLDRYERLGSRYYREWVQLTDGRHAWVYRRIEESAW